MSYFRFSKFQENRGSLRKWEAWFAKKGIKTKIVKDGKKLALWREGKEEKV